VFGSINIVLLKLKYSPKLWVFKTEKGEKLVFVSQALEYFGLENELPILDLILVCATHFCDYTV
jgi:hypothetical protein